MKGRDFVFPNPSERVKKCSSLLVFSWHSGLPCSISQTNSLAASEGHQALLLPYVSPSSWFQRDNRNNNPGLEKQEDDTVSLQTLSISCAESHTFLLQALVKRRQLSLLKNPNVAVFVFLGFVCAWLWILGFQIKDVCCYN